MVDSDKTLQIWVGFHDIDDDLLIDGNLKFALIAFSDSKSFSSKGLEKLHQLIYKLKCIALRNSGLDGIFIQMHIDIVQLRDPRIKENICTACIGPVFVGKQNTWIIGPYNIERVSSDTDSSQESDSEDSRVQDLSGSVPAFVPAQVRQNQNPSTVNVEVDLRQLRLEWLGQIIAWIYIPN